MERISVRKKLFTSGNKNDSNVCEKIEAIYLTDEESNLRGSNLMKRFPIIKFYTVCLNKATIQVVKVNGARFKSVFNKKR